METLSASGWLSPLIPHRTLRGLAVILLGVAVGFSGCGPRAYSDYDRAVDLHQYKTYGWLNQPDIEIRNNPVFYNELNDSRIKRAVDRYMLAKGYLFTEQDPDLLLHYHIVVEDQTRMQTMLPGFYYGPYWINRNVWLQVYRQGTLLLDFMDRRGNKLLWRGGAIDVLDAEIPEMQERRINRAVTAIFQKYPYRAAESSALKDFRE